MIKTQAYLASAADYLRFEFDSPIRHEYVDGEIFAMTGGSLRHNRIGGNIYACLLGHLAGSPCNVFINDVKLHVKKANAYYYPDVMVRCAPLPQADNDTVIVDPVVVVEVLSPSTEAIDRREKLSAYRSLPSLMEYVLVAQESRCVEIYRRRGDIGWQHLIVDDGDSVSLTSVDLELSMATIYAGTQLPADSR